jgi:hypothetical protein
MHHGKMAVSIGYDIITKEFGALLSKDPIVSEKW